MNDRPTASELLQVVAQLFDDELLPALEGSLQYRVRVAANLTKIRERQARLGVATLTRERTLLCGVLGLRPEGLGTDPELERRAHAALLEIARDKLAIARPGYDDYESSQEGRR